MREFIRLEHVGDGRVFKRLCRQRLNPLHIPCRSRITRLFEKFGREIVVREPSAGVARDGVTPQLLDACVFVACDPRQRHTRRNGDTE